MAAVKGAVVMGKDPSLSAPVNSFSIWTRIPQPCFIHWTLLPQVARSTDGMPTPPRESRDEVVFIFRMEDPVGARSQRPSARHPGRMTGRLRGMPLAPVSPADSAPTRKL